MPRIPYRLLVCTLLTLPYTAVWAAENPVHQRCSAYLDKHPPAPVPYALSVAPAAMQAEAAAAYATAEKSLSSHIPATAVPVSPQNTERYGHYPANPVRSTAEHPVSTFAADVDTGSYANIRRFLQQENRLPPADAVRIEEIVNYFDYRYPRPQNGQTFAVHTETADSPFREQAKLLRIGIQTAERDTAELPPANLVFLIDVSGSMNHRDKLPLVQYTLCTLAHQTRAQDRISIITYASGEKTVLPPTPGNRRAAILQALDALQAGGATAGEQAIQTAYRTAKQNFLPHGINRILLATDGDFNVGITDFETLKSLAAEQRRSGISLTTLGFGRDNYNEQLMEQLADAGDGNYSYIDTPAEARKVLQRQLASTLATVARDVKIQVEFNPAAVKEYRLIGYENRLLQAEDFNNDQADAGEVGAGHSVTALYEIIEQGRNGWLPDSRYRPAVPPAGTADEYAHIKIRYTRADTGQTETVEHTVPAAAKPLAEAQASTKLAAAAAAYGERLRGGKYSGRADWHTAAALVQSAAFPDPHGTVGEFAALIKLAQTLSATTPAAPLSGSPTSPIHGTAP